MSSVGHAGLYSLVLWAPRGYEVASFLHVTAKDAEARGCDLKNGLRTEPGTDEGREDWVSPMTDLWSTQKWYSTHG